MCAYRSLLSVLVWALLSGADQGVAYDNKVVNVWQEAGKVTGLLLQNCIPHRRDADSVGDFVEKCVRKRTLALLDGLAKQHVITISDNVRLVRYDDHRSRHLTGPVTYNDTDGMKNWEEAVVQRIGHVFDTHLLTIRFGGLDEQARGRKKKQSMLLSLIAFGIATIGLMLVPMGFQFLAVLGGKALLLSKMALLLTAIQGLKKIAKSNINYGLYTTDEHSPAGNYHYERRWPPHEDHHRDPFESRYQDNESNKASTEEHPLKFPHPRIDTELML